MSLKSTMKRSIARDVTSSPTRKGATTSLFSELGTPRALSVRHSSDGGNVMNDQNASLALGLATLFFEFALDLALTGDPDHAFSTVSASRKTEQDEQVALENLFWD